MPSRKKSGGSSTRHPLVVKLETGRLQIKGGEARFALHNNISRHNLRRIIDVEHLRPKDELLSKVENLIIVSADENTSLATVENYASPPALPMPPSSLLLSLLLPANKSTTDFITNMEEMYQLDWVPKHGQFWAKFIWWTQNVRYLLSRLVMPLGGLVLGAIQLFKLR